jgi:hypothetical protein
MPPTQQTGTLYNMITSTLAGQYPQIQSDRLMVELARLSGAMQQLLPNQGLSLALIQTPGRQVPTRSWSWG